MKTSSSMMAQNEREQQQKKKTKNERKTRKTNVMSRMFLSPHYWRYDSLIVTIILNPSASFIHLLYTRVLCTYKILSLLNVYEFYCCHLLCCRRNFSDFFYHPLNSFFLRSFFRCLSLSLSWLWHSFVLLRQI